MMPWDVDELPAHDAVVLGVLALVGGDGEHIIAREAEFPVAVGVMQVEMALNASGEDLRHILRHPETV